MNSSGLGSAELQAIDARGESKNFRIQYLRAIAAFCVLVFHAAYYLKTFRGAARIMSIIPDILGGFGVCLFFAISGSLMAVLARRTPPDTFICHRIIRIYPIYWMLLAATALVSVEFGETFTFDPFAAALIPGDGRGYTLGVEWTLPFELSFYLVIFFVILLRLRKALDVIAAIWAILIVATIDVHPDPEQYQFPRLAGLLLSQWTLPFTFGLLVPSVVGRGLAGRWALPAGALLLATMWSPIGGQLILSGACLCFVGWAALPRAQAGGTQHLTILMRFGDWSYALYLCHVPVITLLFLRLPQYVNSLVLFAIAIGVALLISSIVGRVDLALYNALKLLTDRSSSTFRYGIGSTFVALMLVCAAYAEIAAASDRASLASADDLGARLSDGSLATISGIAEKAQTIGFKLDPTIRGAIDYLGRDSDGKLRISGWALDSNRSRGEVVELVFYGGQYLGAASTRLARPDVDIAIGRHSIFSAPGFDSAIRSAAICQPGATLAVLATTLEKRFVMLAAPDGSAACPGAS